MKRLLALAVVVAVTPAVWAVRLLDDLSLALDVWEDR
jgi:hypothetical protein